jgi:hypothetical protein
MKLLHDNNSNKDNRKFQSTLYFFPAKSKHSAQCPLVKHPQSMFFPQWVKPAFTTIQKPGTGKVTDYFNLYAVSYPMGSSNNLNSMVESKLLI